MEQGMQQVPAVVSSEEIPKSRVHIEVYGALNVKIPYNIKNIKSAPYLLLEMEIFKEELCSIYPELASKIMAKDDGSSARAARMNSDSTDSDSGKMATATRAWLRPWSFHWLKGESTHADKVEALLEKYPQGLYAVVIEDMVAEKVPESLDEHWTISKSPVSRSLHADPMGAPAVPIQEMYNEAIDLTSETIAQGVPETFADPNVLNFGEYATKRAEPGKISPARPRPGMNLEQSFYTLKPAVLNKEVPTFASDLLQAGQLVTKAFPSVYGGSMQGGSKTYAEYEKSRTQALSSLGTTWIMLNSAIAELDEKAVEEYRASMLEDEHFTQKMGGGFQNIWIRQSEMKGKIGRVEPETSENFPMTWAEKRAAVFELLGMQLDPVNMALFNSENMEMTTSVIGLTDFKIPGQADRDDELLIIQELLQGQPQLPQMMMDPGMGGEGMPPSEGPPPGMGMEPPPPTEDPQVSLDQGGGMGTPPTPMSSVPVEAQVENHQVRIEVLQAWCVSPEGREAKKTNPAGYANVLAHLNEHMMVAQQQAMQQAMMQGGPPQPGAEESKVSGGGGDKGSAPTPPSPEPQSEQPAGVM